MKTISASEARRRFAEITDEVRTTGETYSVVRHGKELVRITPPRPSNDTDVDTHLEQDIDEFFNEYRGVLEELAKR